MRRLPASPIGLRGQLSVHSSNRCSTPHGQVLKILLGLFIPCLKLSCFHVPENAVQCRPCKVMARLPQPVQRRPLSQA